MRPKRRASGAAFVLVFDVLFQLCWKKHRALGCTGFPEAIYNIGLVKDSFEEISEIL